VNRSELVDRIATDTSLTRTDVTAVLSAFEGAVVDAVKGGDKVQLAGFLTFERGQRAARTARNPRTGEALAIPAAVVPKVKVGKTFKDALAG
jgi:DNA-binding protein HU-beta